MRIQTQRICGGIAPPHPTRLGAAVNFDHLREALRAQRSDRGRGDGSRGRDAHNLGRPHAIGCDQFPTQGETHEQISRLGESGKTCGGDVTRIHERHIEPARQQRAEQKSVDMSRAHQAHHPSASGEHLGMNSQFLR